MSNIKDEEYSTPIFHNKTNATRLQTLHVLQVYRGLAVLFVVCYHATLLTFNQYHWHGFNGLLSWGFSGVHLFFVLSGFIIFSIHFDDIGRPHRALHYLYKRIVRIYPAYWVVLFISSLAFSSNITSIDGDRLFDNFTLLRTSHHEKIVIVAWTLSHEIFFYLVFLTLILKRSLGLMLILVLMSMEINQLAVNMGVISRWSLFTDGSTYANFLRYGVYANLFNLACEPINILFALGALSFFVTKRLKDHPKREFIALSTANFGVILYVIACVYWLNVQSGYDNWTPFNAIFGIAASFLMVGSASDTIEKWASKRSFLLLCGDASYSIYLVHIGLQLWMLQRLGPVPVAINPHLIFIFFIVLPILIGFIFCRVVEAPLLRFCGRQRKSQ